LLRLPLRRPPKRMNRRPQFPKLRVVFFGTSEFAVPSLRAVADAADLRLVVTQPDRPGGRGQRMQPTPVKAAARELQIATLEPQRLRDAVGRLAEERADAFVVVSYGKIVPQRILDLPARGALNVHPSLLPLYRGATPLQSALRDGRRESGVSIIAMDAGMDTGDLVLQERTALGEQETYGELHDRYAALGAQLLVRALARLESGTLERIAQSSLGVCEDEIAATATHPLTKEDLRIDWAWPAERVLNAIRSLVPQPLARAELAGQSVKVAAARRAGADESRAPGSVVCGDGIAVVLDAVVPPNRGRMSGADFLRAAVAG
jgi:methionyl-tRNA formyltransferase